MGEGPEPTSGPAVLQRAPPLPFELSWFLQPHEPSFWILLESGNSSLVTAGTPVSRTNLSHGVDNMYIVNCRVGINTFVHTLHILVHIAALTADFCQNTDLGMVWPWVRRGRGECFYSIDHRSCCQGLVCSKCLINL